MQKSVSTAEAVQIDDIRAAVDRLRGHVVRTPLLESELLNRAAGRRVLVKAECLQRTGSFKLRGAWNHIHAMPRSAIEGGVLAYSSGNHAQGVACAAAAAGVPATIVMPDDAPALKRANTAAYGAQIVTYDRAAGLDRESLGARLVTERGLHLVKPFDDPYVIAGQATVGVELAAQAREAGIETADVAVCCGGGGLSSGAALAFEADAPGLTVRPTEPVGFDDWRRSFLSGRREENEARTGSICDAILTASPGELTWPIGRRLFGPPLAISDDDARRAMATAARHLKIVLEPGGAAALAAALFQPDAFDGDVVIAVATGGNVDSDAFRQWTSFERWSDGGLPIS